MIQGGRAAHWNTWRFRRDTADEPSTPKSLSEETVPVDVRLNPAELAGATCPERIRQIVEAVLQWLGPGYSWEHEALSRGQRAIASVAFVLEEIRNGGLFQCLWNDPETLAQAARGARVLDRDAFGSLLDQALQLIGIEAGAQISVEHCRFRLDSLDAASREDLDRWSDDALAAADWPAPVDDAMCEYIDQFGDEFVLPGIPDEREVITALIARARQLIDPNVLSFNVYPERDWSRIEQLLRDALLRANAIGDDRQAGLAQSLLDQLPYLRP